jgi:hypothetical protein
MTAHIAMMKALLRHQPKPAPGPRRKRAKAYRIIRQALGAGVRLRPRFASMESPAYKTDV